MFWKKKRPDTYWLGKRLFVKETGINVGIVFTDTDQQWRATIDKYPERFQFDNEENAKRWTEKNWKVELVQ